MACLLDANGLTPMIIVFIDMISVDYIGKSSSVEKTGNQHFQLSLLDSCRASFIRCCEPPAKLLICYNMWPT